MLLLVALTIQPPEWFHSNIHIHSYTHINTHTYAHLHTNTNMHVHTNTHSPTHILRHTSELMHSLEHTHTHTQTNKLTLKNTRPSCRATIVLQIFNTICHISDGSSKIMLTLLLGIEPVTSACEANDVNNGLSAHLCHKSNNNKP